VERLLRPVEQAGLQEVLAELVQRVVALVHRQVRAAQQVLVDADRAVRLAAAAKQVAEREVQLDRLGVELGDLDERIDRLVGCSFNRKFRPRKYERGRLALSDRRFFRS
jgi:hypothetical protein